MNSIMAFGLKSNTVEKIRSVFNQYKQIDKVILFGSRAKGNYDNGSDIDLTLIGSKIDLSMLNTVEGDLDNLLLPYIIDLSIYDQIQNENLLEHIKRVGIDFYSKVK